MTDCLFCKIIAAEIPADILYEDDDVLVFRDVNPVSPTHALAIPKKHISSLNELERTDGELIGKMHLAAKRVATDEGIDQQGYRTVINTGANGGQTVFHIHLHILGGRQLNWPPG